MRVTDNITEFFSRTGMIFDVVRLNRLGLHPDRPLGSFWPSEVDQLLAFCAADPDFHIVTYLGEWIYINRYEKCDGLFFLAEGDADPKFMLNRKYSENLIPSIKQR